MYVGKYASDLNILGYSFSSYWTFSLAAVLLATPILTVANYGFGITFFLGLKYFERIWTVLIMFIAAQIFSSIISSLIFFKEPLQKGAIVGISLALLGMIVEKLWK